MEDGKKIGFGKRVGAVAGRGAGHTAAWIGKYIAAPVAVVVALAYFAIPYLAGQVKETITGPKLTPQVQLEVANRRCALAAGYHDGKTKLERLGAAMAHINLAKAKGMTTGQIYDDFHTLAIPDGKVISVRSCTFDYDAYRLTNTQRGNWSTVELALDECLNDQAKCFRENPWLACVKYEIRNTWKVATPRPDLRLRSDTRVRRVFPENPGPDDAEFFCDR